MSKKTLKARPAAAKAKPKKRPTKTDTVKIVTKQVKPVEVIQIRPGVWQEVKSIEPKAKPKKAAKR